MPKKRERKTLKKKKNDSKEIQQHDALHARTACRISHEGRQKEESRGKGLKRLTPSKKTVGPPVGPVTRMPELTCAPTNEPAHDTEEHVNGGQRSARQHTWLAGCECDHEMMLMWDGAPYPNSSVEAKGRQGKARRTGILQRCVLKCREVGDDFKVRVGARHVCLYQRGPESSLRPAAVNPIGD